MTDDQHELQDNLQLVQMKSPTFLTRRYTLVMT